ncbi:MAG TPA: tetratricopeptide repeat protein [Candidatus Saccharimonadales bacterium]|nr:tetratricopeptide repeat protein [Candidatus Saccharimonadales bacterium]
MTNHPAGSDHHWMNWGLCVFLAAITLAVFGRTTHYGFVNCDDGTYVYENPAVQQGLTLKGIGWAFTHFVAGNWHPLTMISYMADYQFHGLKPGGYHLTNVLLHTVAVILLFLVLEEMTGKSWRSAFVAAVFAIHPLRAESVAWISERKDVLSGVFFMLTLWAYIRYARRPFSYDRYLWVVLALALGLMAKPMLVTVPFVLLLLDYWPLNRFSNSAGPRKGFSISRRIVFEKLPLLALSIGACVVAVLAQRSAVVLDNLPALPLRVENALVSYVIYIWQMFYPAGLACLYPLPSAELALWKVIFSLAVLVAISALVLFRTLKRPYLLAGWLWYLGMLVPVIGLVQVGLQAHADRYTYLPEIGLYLALTWLAGELFARWHCPRWLIGSAAVLAIVGLSAGAVAQISYWHDSESLWNRALVCTADNVIANNNLGEALLQKRRVDEAITHFRKALEIQPDNVLAQSDLAVALFQKGQVSEAFDHFRKALALRPTDPLMHYNFGYALLGCGQVNEAAAQFQKAVELQPDYAQDLRSLGNAALHRGQVDEAIVLFQTLVGVHPGDAEAHYILGVTYLQKGEVNKAIDHLQAVLKSQPDNADARNALAWVLATSPDPSIRNGNRAIELAQRANALSRGTNPVFLGTLAAAYAETGHFPEAIASAQQALQLAASQNNARAAAIAAALQEQLKSYQAGSPFRDPNLKNVSDRPNQP